MNNQTVTISILTYDHLRKTEQTLLGIKSGEVKPTQLIYVDDYSNEGFEYLGDNDYTRRLIGINFIQSKKLRLLRDNNRILNKRVEELQNKLKKSYSPRQVFMSSLLCGIGLALGNYFL